MDLVDLLDRTGSIEPPENGDWRPKLARILASASDNTDDILLEDLGVQDMTNFFRRLSGYAREHERA